MMWLGNRNSTVERLCLVVFYCCDFAKEGGWKGGDSKALCTYWLYSAVTRP